MTIENIVNTIEQNLTELTIVVFSSPEQLNVIREAYAEKHPGYRNISTRKIEYKNCRILFGHEDNRYMGCGLTPTSAIFINCSHESALYQNLIPSLVDAKQVWI